LIAMGLAEWSAAAPRIRAAAVVDGQYAIQVAGSLTGSGVATKQGRVVQIAASVAQDDEAGSFSATLQVTGNHFSGTGTAMGRAITIYGRLDSSGDDARKGKLKSSRIVGCYASESGQRGRIAGVIPLTAGHDAGNDHANGDRDDDD
jgi:hypothetical protein